MTEVAHQSIERRIFAEQANNSKKTQVKLTVVQRNAKLHFLYLNYLFAYYFIIEQ